MKRACFAKYMRSTLRKQRAKISCLRVSELQENCTANIIKEIVSIVSNINA